MARTDSGNGHGVGRAKELQIHDVGGEEGLLRLDLRHLWRMRVAHIAGLAVPTADRP